MQIVSAREFRLNQGKVLTQANRGQSVIITSRYGNFKIVPVSENDSLTERIAEGLHEAIAIEQGKAKGFSVSELLNEL